MKRFSHLDDKGKVCMVDVGGKEMTKRRAAATGRVVMSAETVAAISESNLPKGDVLAVARIAGIMAAKRTAEFIPMCHPLPLDGVSVDFEFESDGVLVKTEVRTSAKTGVEMEALVAASTACLTIYDMCKSADRQMQISDVRVTMKEGGRHDFTA